MEAVKWDLNRANKITIYSGKNEVMYQLLDGKWHGAGITVGSKSMKLLIEKYEKAGCIIIPEAGAYIPTDTYVVRIGKWQINFAEQWKFRPVEQYRKDGGKWKDDYGNYITDLQLLRFINDTVGDNEITRFYNENMEVIGHYE